MDYDAEFIAMHLSDLEKVLERTTEHSRVEVNQVSDFINLFLGPAIALNLEDHTKKNHSISEFCRTLGQRQMRLIFARKCRT